MGEMGGNKGKRGELGTRHKAVFPPVPPVSPHSPPLFPFPPIPHHFPHFPELFLVEKGGGDLLAGGIGWLGMVATWACGSVPGYRHLFGLLGRVKVVQSGGGSGT